MFDYVPCIFAPRNIQHSFNVKTVLFQAVQFSQTVLIQTIQFNISIDFVYMLLNIKQFSLV